MSPNLSINEAVRISGEATINLAFEGSTVDKDFGEIIDRRAPELLPSFTQLLRMMLSAELVNSTNALPETPARIMGLLQEPIVKFGTLSLAAEGPMRLFPGEKLPLDDPYIAENFDAMKTSLFVIAGLALRGIVDGHKAGWWTAAPLYEATRVTE